ncbi:MAG: protease modulator HflK [Gammaproteobacteria bacterium]|nr:protease modulator HflK [Gammaproteobacteria bacterium]MDE2345916.1 protease modulator HflK [Gammaproteobacteria bacterium]
MVWNEPGKDKDPWNNTERSPELERLVKNLHKFFSGWFGGRSGGPLHLRAATLWWLLPLIVATWLLSGFYRVAPGERGVQFFLGQYAQTATPGMHWHVPWPAGRAILISGVEGRDYTRNYNRLLTGDGNIVSLDAAAQYHVEDIRKYLFNAAVSGAGQSADAGARALLGGLVDDAVRTAVAHSTLENLMGSGQDAVVALASQHLKGLLQAYDTGMVVTGLSFQHVSLPASMGNDGIAAAQQDATKAKAAAQAYAEDLLPSVKSQADARIAKARLYRTQLVNQAQADVSGFNAVLAGYRKAPALTREMLYTQTMQEILADADKVVVDSSGNVTVQLTPPSPAAQAGAENTRVPVKTPAMAPANSATTAPAAGTRGRLP